MEDKLNSLRKAFTLIELLVVIAIIAILAAILFPVFAQAKAAAKSSACLNNVKQIATAAIMYAGDYDDVTVPCQTWDTEARVNGVQTTKGGHLFNSWRALVFPYMKNLDIVTDPSAPAIYKDPNFASAPTANFLLYGNLAMNHMAMGPSYYNGSTFVPKGVSMTSLGEPAATVYFTEMYNAGTEATSEYVAAPAYYWTGMVDAPMCWDTALSGTDANQVDGNVACIWNWGKNSGWDTDLGLSIANGGQTGGLAQRSASGANVSWADGHAKKLSIGALAAGTTFQVNQDANNTHFVIANISKYVWDNK
ncbi:MAG: hypothetical protein BGO01_18765 [Armatimonadetes bacterium 55-13]|nr:MAG: hypothetical protein ABT09_00195 [bacterium SCN 57-13]OJU64170.1 MAG: hypothetical protein BGO01_18765 [Armatimonadetes bacterium 55-13]